MEQKVIKLSTELEQTSHPNKNYRDSKLKLKLEELIVQALISALNPYSFIGMWSLLNSVI